VLPASSFFRLALMVFQGLAFVPGPSSEPFRLSTKYPGPTVIGLLEATGNGRIGGCDRYSASAVKTQAATA